MNINANTLLIGLLAGAVGMGYLVYGRRQAKWVPILAGIALCVYPYFIDSVLWLCVLGVLLMVIPFIIDF